MVSANLARLTPLATGANCPSSYVSSCYSIPGCSVRTFLRSMLFEYVQSFTDSSYAERNKKAIVPAHMKTFLKGLEGLTT